MLASGDAEHLVEVAQALAARHHNAVDFPRVPRADERRRVRPGSLPAVAFGVLDACAALNQRFAQELAPSGAAENDDPLARDLSKLGEREQAFALGAFLRADH